MFTIWKKADDQCLRIDGIALEDNETVERCFMKVKDVLKELKVSMPEGVVDRADRIGKPKILQGKRCHTMIVLERIVQNTS